MNKLFRFLSLLLLICGMCFILVASVGADGENDTEKKALDITLSPKNSLFDINNMKPGDWAPRTITVKNTGSQNFDYQMKLQNNGEKKLFNELLLEVKAGNEGLFNGKLADFKSLPIRKLTTGSEENLDIIIRFPEHLGNEFQGLLTAFDFTFTAEGNEVDSVQEVIIGQADSSGSPMSPGSSILPDNATNLINYMLLTGALAVGGFVMIIFIYYRKLRVVQ